MFATPPLQLSFFFTDTATTELYTLSLHDALPICARRRGSPLSRPFPRLGPTQDQISAAISITRVARLSRNVGQPDHILANPITSHKAERRSRSEEHTSELQSLAYLVCRLLLEKKK